MNFWTDCVSIRTEKGAMKVNPPLASYSKKHDTQCVTKVPFENKMVVTIPYFFKSAEQKAEFLNSNSFLVEGYLALENPTNVYGFLMQGEKV